MPVTTTSSACGSTMTLLLRALGTVGDLTRRGVDGSRSRRRRLAERLCDRLRGVPAEPGHLGDLVDRRRAQLLQRAEVPQQRLATHLTQTGYAVERARGHGLG